MTDSSFVVSVCFRWGFELSAMRLFRMTVVVLTAALLFVACGDDSSSDVGGSSTPDPTAGTEDGGTEDGGDTTSSGSGLAPGTGFIQIGDLRHELTVELCANIFDAINGRAISVSDPDTVKVVFNISPEDWQERGLEEPGSIQYSESLAYSWTTGQRRYIDDYELPADIDPSTIAIGSYDIADDGEAVTGEATFYDLNALVYATPAAPETGSFAFACPSS